jgi:hypothetical protein
MRRVILALLVAGTGGCFDDNLYQEEACYTATAALDGGAPACAPPETAAPQLVAPRGCDKIVSVESGPVIPDGGLTAVTATCCYLATVRQSSAPCAVP